jgi:3-oxoacyl-[acyl-carrier-protein] synthase II
MTRRVVVTGMGTVTPVGHDVPSTWKALVAGCSGVKRITAFDASILPVHIAAEVKDFDATAYLAQREARRADRFAQFALVAAQEAVTDASLSLDGPDNEHVGVLTGTGIGGILTLVENVEILQQRGPRKVSPLLVPMMMPNAAAGQIAIHFGLQGPNFALASACASGAHAIGEAAAIVRRGGAEVMICGASEAAIVPVALAGFSRMGALSQRNEEPERASCPFDDRRDGFVVGEGAGVLVLESLEHARMRGAHIYAELVGYGASADATHITAPSEDGLGATLCMRSALDDAGLRPEAVDYINAHGTGTPLNDKTETLAIKTVFGEHAHRLAVSSTKSMIGHLLGASGAVEAVATLKALQTGVLPPTINYECPDPDCDLDYVPNIARSAHPQVALSNSFGFGGHNATLIFRRLEG